MASDIVAEPGRRLFKGRAKPDADLVHYGKVSWQVFNKPWLGQETFQCNDYFGGGEVVRKTQYDDAAILFRRVAGRRQSPSRVSAAHFQFDGRALRSEYPERCRARCLGQTRRDVHAQKGCQSPTAAQGAMAHPAGRHSRPELYSMREAFLR